MNVAVRTARERAAWGTRGALRRLTANADARALGLIFLAFALLAALSWRAWGVPSVDAGHELTVAGAIAEGAQPFGDIRYFYGPAGVYLLAAAFAVFGTGFTTAFAFGLLQAAAIIVAFYALSRQLLAVVPALIATLVVAAIGFSGTPFNFVLPHTNSATFGLLFLLLTLLALSRERLVLAGLAAGVVGLSRPEMAAVGVLLLAVYLIGTARQRGGRAALTALPRLAVPALAVPAVVLGLLAAEVGAARLFTENLWPVDFLRIAGFASQEAWAPLDLESLAATLARATIYCTLLAAAVAAALGVSRASRNGERLRALWPIPAALLTLGLLDLAWRALGVFAPAQAAVQHESTHLLIGMSWLPALGFAAAAAITVRFLRGGTAPISGSWGFDLALVAVAAALGARAYDAFTAEASYAPYYAPPLVLLLAVLHDRLSRRWPQARGALLAALAAVGLGVATYTAVALNPDDSSIVRTPRGTFVTTPGGAAALQPTIEFIDARTAPGEPVLAVPAEAGFNFMTGRPPALYDPMFLPGLLDSPADELAAIARLEAEGVRYAVVDRRTFVNYGYEHFGEEYNRRLAAWIEREGPPVATFGDGRRAAGTNPGTAYDVYRVGP